MSEYLGLNEYFGSRANGGEYFMEPWEIRDAELTRRYVLEGLWEQLVAPVTAATVRPVLTWAMAVAAAGQPLPPLGFLADLGHLAFGLALERRSRHDERKGPGLTAELARAYEDQVLGKLAADWSFERACDALRRYRPDEQPRGLAYLHHQLWERAGYPVVVLNPAAIKGLLELPAETALSSALETRARHGVLPLVPKMYQGLIAAARRSAEVLAAEDVFELEHRTALFEFGQRLALRQLLQAVQHLEAELPPQRLRSRRGVREVPTRILEEDTYPVGGYSSLSTRGSIESLLHFQLAYMEKQERPDLFDVKFLREELLYYSRDENQFLRRRRTYVLTFFPDLERTRFKDAELPWQRGVLLLALLLATIRKLGDWLSTEALFFDCCFLGKGAHLQQEEELVRMVLREAIANGTVQLTHCQDLAALTAKFTHHARRSMCHGLLIATKPPPSYRVEHVPIGTLQIDTARPILQIGEDASDDPEPDSALNCWRDTLKQLLQAWL